MSTVNVIGKKKGEMSWRMQLEDVSLLSAPKKTQHWPRTWRSGGQPGPGGWGDSGEKGSFPPYFRSGSAV